MMDKDILNEFIDEFILIDRTEEYVFDEELIESIEDVPGLLDGEGKKFCTHLTLTENDVFDIINNYQAGGTKHKTAKTLSILHEEDFETSDIYFLEQYIDKSNYSGKYREVLGKYAVVLVFVKNNKPFEAGFRGVPIINVFVDYNGNIEYEFNVVEFHEEAMVGEEEGTIKYAKRQYDICMNLLNYLKENNENLNSIEDNIFREKGVMNNIIVYEQYIRLLKENKHKLSEGLLRKLKNDGIL